MSNPATLVPFKRGHDNRRNITGANKGSRWLSTKLEEALKHAAEGKKETYDVLLIKRVLRKAIIDGDMRAIELIWDRLEGGVERKHEKEENKTQVNIFIGDQLKRIAARVLNGDTEGKGTSD